VICVGSRPRRAKSSHCGAVESRSARLARIIDDESIDAADIMGRRLSMPGNDGAETALRGWPYRTRTSMCREKIHLFDKSREFGFKRPGQTVVVSWENNLLCYAASKTTEREQCRTGARLPNCRARFTGMPLRRQRQAGPVRSRILLPLAATTALPYHSYARWQKDAARPH